MQLTASGSHRALEPARASPAPLRRFDAPGSLVPRSASRHSVKRGDPVGGRTNAARAVARRARQALALAISVGLHVALLVLISGALVPMSKPASFAPALESHVVHVHLAPAAADGDATADPRTMPRRVAPSRPSSARAPAPQAIQAIAEPVTQASAVEPAPAAAAESPAAPVAMPPPAGAGASPPPVTSAAMPAYLHAPDPEYPQSAREDGQEGLVVLRVLVSGAGRPAQIRVVKTSGFRALDAAALAGVKRWTFSPAKEGERGIDAWMEVPIRFRLQ